jgi:hypothetical protein
MRSVINWIAYLKNWPTWALIIYLAIANRLHTQPIPDYFPMHIGDTWTYKLTTGGPTRHWANQTIKITDTTAIQQQKYFVFEDKIYDLYYERGKVYENTHYYRKSDNGDIMKFNKLLNNEQLYYTFQRDSLYKSYFYFDEFDLIRKWKVTFYRNNSIIRIPLGVFLNCHIYSFGDWSNGRVFFSIFRYLAPNIGLLEETVEGDDNFLVGAYINGKLLGDTTLTSIKEIAQPNVLLHPVLFPNYPNPFSNTTHITYYIPEFWKEPIQISIFDITGREISILVQERFIRGSHEVLWNGKNKHGKEVSNGIYMIRLTSGQFTKTIKLNYLR